MKNRGTIVLLGCAQFVMVLDSSVMNVSISQIVADLDTTIQGVQLAITAYTLVMAALMLAGAKLGDILGRDRTFAIGLAIYGVGCVGLLDLVGRVLAHHPVDDRADHGDDDHDQDPRRGRFRAEMPAHDVDDRQDDDDRDHEADEAPEKAHTRIVLDPPDADNRARTTKP